MTPDSKTQAHTHTLTRIYTHAHKRAAGNDEIAEPDASAAVYLALFHYLTLIFEVCCSMTMPQQLCSNSAAV